MRTPDELRIVLSTDDMSAWHHFQEHAQTWRITYQAEIGVAEMALGAALLAWGISSSQLLMGEDVLANKLSDIGSAAGAVVGSTAGAALASTVLHGLL